jgi:hypothetical protein
MARWRRHSNSGALNQMGPKHAAFSHQAKSQERPVRKQPPMRECDPRPIRKFGQRLMRKFDPEGQPDISRGRKPPDMPASRHAPEGRKRFRNAGARQNLERKSLPPLPGRASAWTVSGGFRPRLISGWPSGPRGVVAQSQSPWPPRTGCSVVEYGAAQWSVIEMVLETLFPGGIP